MDVMLTDYQDSGRQYHHTKAPLALLYDRVLELEYAGDSDSEEHDILTGEIMQRAGISDFDELPDVM